LPGGEFLLVGVDGLALEVAMAVDGQSFVPLPALRGANGAVEEGSNFFPGFKAIGLCLHSGTVGSRQMFVMAMGRCRSDDVGS